MGMRRRTRRRALVAGAAIGHASANRQNDAYAQGQADAAPPPDDYANQAPPPAPAPPPAAPTPPPADPYDQIEHLAELHSSGALTDEEFASAKAKILGS